tara:strand:+ start:1088 stop:1651 length:564 start_codon:yes stop_codon:yes gene_type:complete
MISNISNFLIVFFCTILLFNFFNIKNLEAEEVLCGIHYSADEISENILKLNSVNLAAFVLMDDNERDRCSRVLYLLNKAKKGDNNFKKNFIQMTNEIDLKIDDSFSFDKKLKMIGLRDCHIISSFFVSYDNICNYMDKYKVYFIVTQGNKTNFKDVFDISYVVDTSLSNNYREVSTKIYHDFDKFLN